AAPGRAAEEDLPGLTNRGNHRVGAAVVISVGRAVARVEEPHESLVDLGLCPRVLLPSLTQGKPTPTRVCCGDVSLGSSLRSVAAQAAERRPRPRIDETGTKGEFPATGFTVRPAYPIRANRRTASNRWSSPTS